MISNSANITADFFDQITQDAIWSLKVIGLDVNSACEIADQTVSDLKNNLGGEQLYIPLGQLDNVNLKHQQIRADFNGNNQYELAKKYKLSIQTIYRTLKKQQEPDVASEISTLELLNQINSVIRNSLESNQVHSTAAKNIAVQIIHNIKANFGGFQVYIPRKIKRINYVRNH